MVIRYASADEGRQMPPSADRLVRDTGPSVGERLSGIAARARAATRRARLRMGLAAALPLACVLAYGQIAPATYHTSATVFVETQVGRAARPESEAGILSGQLRLATSRAILQRAAEKEKLAEDPTFEARPAGLQALLRAAIALVRGEAAAPSTGNAAAVLDMLARSVQARRGEGANLIEIAAGAADPAAAMRMANAVAQSFVEEVLATSDTATGTERSRLAQRGEELKARLRDAETRLATYRAQNGYETGARPVPVQDDPAAQIQRLRAATLEAKARYEQMQKLFASGKDVEAIADLIRSPSIDRLRIQYNEAAAQEASFRTSLGPRHPAYLEAAQQAKEKKRLLMEGLRLAGSAARADWQAARDQEAAFEARGPVVTPAQPAAPTMMLQDLERNAELARAAYDRYLRSFDTPDPSAQQVAARLVAAAPLPTQAERTGLRTAWSLAVLSSVGFAALFWLAAFIRGERGLPPLAAPAPMPSQAPARAAPAVATPVPPQAQPASPLRIRTVGSVFRPASQAPAPPSPAPSSPAPQPVAPPAGSAPSRTAAPATPAREAVIERLAMEIAQRSDGFPLQTVFVTAVAAECRRDELALALARETRRLGLRVLLLDLDEATPDLTLALADGPEVGMLAVQGRQRRALVVDRGMPGACCLIPADAAAPPPSGRALPDLGGIAGNFDLVVLVGPALSGTLAERKLARAAQAVLIGHGPDRPGQIRLGETLGVPAETLRLVPARLRAETPAAARAPAVVRLPRVA